MSAFLELVGVRAGYGGGDILQGLDLSVEEGSLTCIVGPNGAGKSTVLRVISGRQGRGALAAQVGSVGVVAAADAMVPKLLSGAAPDGMREAVRGWVMEQSASALVADLAALRDRPDSRPDLATIDRPALVVRR